MLTREQLLMFSDFKDDIFGELTFNHIKTKSRQKSNSMVQAAIKQFLKEELIIPKKVGDVTTYSLNLNNQAITYLSLIHENEVQNNKKLPKKTLTLIQNRIAKHTPFFILVIFGSYAQDRATEKSDLDIAVITESDQSKKEIIPYLETVKRREITKIDYHMFTTAEFLEMLTAAQENLGKEIYRKNIIYYGTAQYYQLIKKLQNAKTV